MRERIDSVGVSDKQRERERERGVNEMGEDGGRDRVSKGLR